MIASQIASHLPEGWALHNLIYIDPDWQVNICDGEWVVVATGETIEDALAAASAKTLDESQYIGRLACLDRLRSAEPRDNGLLAMLGLVQEQPKMRRI